MDLNNMNFSTGSTFIFGSWICEADSNGKLQSRLLEDSKHHEDYSISATTTDHISRRFAQLMISDSTQVSRLCASDSNSSSVSEMKSYSSAFKKSSSCLARFQSTTQNNSDYPQNFFKRQSSFPFGLDNTTKSYQGQFERSFKSTLGIPLTGAQEGLVLTITSQDCIVH